MPLFYGLRRRLKKCKKLNKNKMQVLKITQEIHVGEDILRLTNEDCNEENLLLEIEDDSYTNSIVIEKQEAEHIVSFLQNYFKL